MSKKMFALLPVLLVVPFLSSCQSDAFDPTQFKVEAPKEYQVYDNFDVYDLKVSYKDLSLPVTEFTVDLKDFDSSKPNTTSKIYVSPFNHSEVRVELPVTVVNRHTANFLSIGTSFGEDMLYYTSLIADNSMYSEGKAFDYNFYSAVLDGETIDTQIKKFNADLKVYTLKKYNDTTSSWESTGNKLSIKECLTYNAIHWDFISLQADPIEAGVPNAYKNLPNYTKTILRFLNDQSRVLPKLCWDFTWAYEDDIQINPSYYEFYDNNQMTMYNCINRTVQQEITSNPDIGCIIPCGTMIQNARTSTLVNEKQFTRNGYNLDNIGKYIVSLGLLAEISGFDASHFIYKGDIVTDEQYQMAVKAVNAALDKPFEVTDISE